MSGTRRRQDGFTLVEVIVAFAIMALSLGSIYQIYASGFRSVRVIAEEHAAVRAAQSVLAAAGRTLPLAPGRIEGSTRDGYPYVLVVEKAVPSPGSPAGLPGGLWVRLELTWRSTGGRPRSVRLETYRLERAKP